MANSKKTKEADTTTMSIVESKKIKSIVMTSSSSNSDYSNFHMKDENYPKIEKEDQLIVRIKAAGLNFAELMQRPGISKPTKKNPYTPGYEASGFIEEVSENITDFKKDDRVIVFSSNGIWKDVVLVPKSNVIKMPDDMTFDDAAGFLANYLTAYQMAFRLANVKSGDSILIHMAAGDVGIALIQLCKTIPDITIFGTASACEQEVIKNMGVDYPIDYKITDYVEQIRKINPDGIDICFDPLNGEHSIKGYELLKPLGTIVHYGATSITGESRSFANIFKTWWKCLNINSFDVISENKRVCGYHLGVLLSNQSFLKTAMTDIKILLEMYEQKKINIQIDSIYGYSKIGEAMKRLYTKQNVGKIILKPDSEIILPITKIEESDETIKTEEIPATNLDLEQVNIENEVLEQDNICTETETTIDPLIDDKPSNVSIEQAKFEEKIIEKTITVSEITKPEIAGECATRE